MKRSPLKRKPYTLKRSPLKRKPYKLRRKSRRATSVLKDRLWTLFSKHIRERDSYICFTCDRYAEGSGMHAGHFIAVYPHESTRFDPMNVNAQCYKCNIFYRGNVAEYSARLIAKYGQEEFNKLIARGRTIKQWSEKELIHLIAVLATRPDDYEAEYRSLVS